MSSQCAREAEKPTSSSSKKIGANTVWSFRCVPVRYESFMIQTSPGRQTARAEAFFRQPGADLEVAEEEREAERLTEHAVVGVEEGDGAVLALVDDGRVRGPDQGRVHVMGGRDEGVADDLGRDRIDTDSGCNGYDLPPSFDRIDP